MRSRIILCCLIAALTAVTWNVPDVTAYAVGNDTESNHAENSKTQEINVTWDRGNEEGVSVTTDYSSKELILKQSGKLFADSLFSNQLSISDGKIEIGADLLRKLENGIHEFTLELKDGTIRLNLNITGNDENTLKADQTSFTWDRNSKNGIVIRTNSTEKDITLFNGKRLLASGILSRYLSVENGEVSIGAELLEKLKDGENELTLEMKDGRITLNVYVTNQQTSEEQYDNSDSQTTDTLSFTWDRNDKTGKAILTHSGSGDFTLYSGKTILASSLINGYVTIENGEVSLDADLLQKLKDGENELTLEWKDKKVTLDIFVTNEEQSSDEASKPVLYANETSVTWDRSSGSDVVIVTNSGSEEITLRSGKQILGSSLINGKLSVENGNVRIGADLLKKLSDGKNELTLEMKDGTIRLEVNVIGQKESSGSGLSADEINFTWDKSDLLGISVYTNSASHSVTIMKDGEVFASNKDIGVSIFSGRVGITSKYLRKLNVGENTLSLVFNDGTIDIHVTVTDNKHISSVITADQTEFTWRKGSASGITFKTDSQSSTLSVRRNGRLLSDTDKDNIIIKNGTVTLKPAYLELLRKGDNTLKLIFDDGSLDIKVKVIGADSGTLPADENGTGTQDKQSDHRSNFGVFDGLPNTGSTTAIVGISAAAVTAAAVGIGAGRRNRKKTNKK